MLTQIFKTVLILSAVGSVLTVMLNCLRPITKKYFSAQWNYYIWCAVLAVMVLPVSIPTSDVITHDAAVVYNSVAANVEYAADMISFDRNGAMAFAGIIWLSVTVLIAFVRIVSYIGFAELLLKNSIFEGKENGVRIYSTDIVDAPLVIGIFRSRLFIPIKKPQKDELGYVMAHELTHCRRHDVAVKWFAMAVCTVHWFNPLSYLLLKRIDEECEISCDAAVTSEMTEEQKKGYMRTVLKMISETRGSAAYMTTKMSGEKNKLIRRFKMIKEFRHKKKSVIVFSAVVGAICICAALITVGIINGRVGENEPQRNLLPEPAAVGLTTPEPVREEVLSAALLNDEPQSVEPAENALPVKKSTEKKQKTTAVLKSEPIRAAIDPIRQKTAIKIGISENEAEKQLNPVYISRIDEADGTKTVHYWQGGNEQISAKYSDGILQSAEVVSINDDVRKFYEESTTKRTYKLTPTDGQKEPVTVIVSHADAGKGDDTYIYGGEFVEEVEKNVPSSMTVTRASQNGRIADVQQTEEKERTEKNDNTE